MLFYERNLFKIRTRKIILKQKGFGSHTFGQAPESTGYKQSKNGEDDAGSGDEEEQYDYRPNYEKQKIPKYDTSSLHFRVQKQLGVEENDQYDYEFWDDCLCYYMEGVQGKSGYGSHTSRTFVSNSTVATFSECDLSMICLKQRGYIGKSIPIDCGGDCTNGYYCRLKCSPDGKLLILSYEFTNSECHGNLMFFKIVPPTDDDPETHIVFCGTNLKGKWAGGAHHEMYFLAKNNGIKWFAQMRSKPMDQSSWTSDYVDNSKAVAAMDIFSFDGKNVRQEVHHFPVQSLITQERSRSWLFENPILNLQGWALGWRNAKDFDEILPTRADDVTPCYLPKDLSLITHKFARLYSLTLNGKQAKFGIKFR